MITWLLALIGIFAVLVYVRKAKRPKEIFLEPLSSASGQNPPCVPDEPRWLSPDQNPFKMTVLDCRPVTTTSVSWTDLQTAKTYGELCRSNGEEYAETSPQNATRSEAVLRYPYLGPEPADGPLFTSESMEEKWHVYIYAKTLYFVRSWTGQLVYKAPINFENSAVTVGPVTFDRKLAANATDATRDVDFLVCSHLFKILALAPFSAAPGQQAQDIATHLFEWFGDFAQYASMEDTISANANQLRKTVDSHATKPSV